MEKQAHHRKSINEIIQWRIFFGLAECIKLGQILINTELVSEDNKIQVLELIRRIKGTDIFQSYRNALDD